MSPSQDTLIACLGGEWFSDSLALSDMNDKTAAEKLQGYWILEIGELAGMKKADIDKVKAFISRQDDKYRASFGRRVTPHPRQCVFFGTTNSENGYLRDITGNRRLWNVKVTGQGKYKPWDMTNEVVQQIWAEVAEIAKAGEKLYLDADLEAFAKQEQREAMEQDDREGIVRNYLDTNNEFKDAMLLAGYQPVNPKDLNWKYRIELTREINDTPSPFFHWARTFEMDATPCRDFVRDMLHDFEFPILAEHDIIARYLGRIGACSGAVEAFEELWREYAGETD